MGEIDSEGLRRRIVQVRRMIEELSAVAVTERDRHGFTLLAVAERMYADRRRRDGAFPAGLFGEPAWDLLLALFIAREEGRGLSLDECARAAVTDESGAHEWLSRLERAGLAELPAAGGDTDAVYLTPLGIERLSDYLARCIEDDAQSGP